MHFSLLIESAQGADHLNKLRDNGELVPDGGALPPISVVRDSGCVELFRCVQLSERPHWKLGGVLEVLDTHL